MACRYGQPDRELVRDLTQDVYLRILAEDCRVLRTLRSQDEPSIAALVQSIAYSVACDHFRRSAAKKRGGAQRPVSLDDAAAPEVPDSGGEQVLRSILFAEIDKALGEVTDESRRTEQRHVFWLYFRHGFTSRDIAGLPFCDLSVKGVESLIFRLTKGVREKLGKPPDSREGKRTRISSEGAGTC